MQIQDPTKPKGSLLALRHWAGVHNSREELLRNLRIRTVTETPQRRSDDGACRTVRQLWLMLHDHIVFSPLGQLVDKRLSVGVASSQPVLLVVRSEYLDRFDPTSSGVVSVVLTLQRCVWIA